jgi:hypothetical protein
MAAFDKRMHTCRNEADTIFVILDFLWYADFHACSANVTASGRL